MMWNNNFYNLFLHSKAINSTLLSIALKKYASPKVEKALNDLGIDEHIKQYVLSLPDEYKGFAFSQLRKNKNLNINDLESHLQTIKNKQNLKQETDEEIIKQIPEPYINQKYYPWLVRQIKKYPKLKKYLTDSVTLQTMNKFLYLYEIDINSYDAPELLKLIDDNLGHFGETYWLNVDLRDDLKFGPANDLSRFFDRVQEKEMQDIQNNLNVPENYDLGQIKQWLLKNFFKIRQEWRKNIENYMRKTGKTFNQILQEGKNIMEAQQRGELRGQEMPNTPLHNPQHNQLTLKLDEIGDWWNNGEISVSRLKEMSLSDVLAEVDRWHQEEAAKGKANKYDEINYSNVVYGPDNWKDKENRGYFILELKSGNDLKTEGFLMDHCVGSYCDQLKNETTRIFSLRHNSDPYKPILTIETDPTGLIVRQDYGPRNSRLDKKFHNMVSEWNENYTSLDDVSAESLLMMPSSDLLKISKKITDSNVIDALVKKILSDSKLQYNDNYISILNDFIKGNNILDKTLNYIIDNDIFPGKILTIAHKDNLSNEVSNNLVDYAATCEGGLAQKIFRAILRKNPKPTIINKIKQSLKDSNILLQEQNQILDIINVINANTSKQLENILQQAEKEAEQEYNYGPILYNILLAALKNPNADDAIVQKIIDIGEEKSFTEIETEVLKAKHVPTKHLLDMERFYKQYINDPRYGWVYDLAKKRLEERGIHTEAFIDLFELHKLANVFQHQTVVPGSKKPIDLIEEKSPISLPPISQDSAPRIGKDGAKRYYNSEGKLHRRDGPAVITPDGNQLYYQFGKLHRDDGPAAIFFNGSSKWYLDNQEISPIEVLQLRINQGKLSIQDIETLKHLAEIAFFEYAKVDLKAIREAGTLLQEKGIIPTRNLHSITNYLKAALKF